MRRIALLCAGLLAALGVAAVAAVAGCSTAVSGGAGAGAPAAAPAGSVSGCTASAYHAILAREALTRRPASCRGLGAAQVNEAASGAIREAEAGGGTTKSERRKRAAVAGRFVTALFTWPVAAVPAAGSAGGSGVAGGSAASGGAGGAGSSGLGGVSEFAVRLAALLAWLATAISGGYVLARWLRAGGSLRRRSVSAVPPSVTVGHAGFGLLGLLLWVVFMLTGWAVLAWTTVFMLGLVAGLGMSVLLLGLPNRRPRDRLPLPAAAEGLAPVPLAGPGGPATLVAPAVRAGPASRPRMPVFVIAAHGLFAAMVLLLVITATTGAG